MEALGGDQAWVVRFLAQHAAVFYFFILLLLWGFSPSRAYNFSELIEAHAVDTYVNMQRLCFVCISVLFFSCFITIGS